MGDVPIIAVVYTILISIFLVWYGLFHLRRRRLYEIAEQYNGPKSLPVIGNALKCLIPLTNFADLALDGTSYYKSPARLWIGPHLVIAIWDPESIRIVMNSSHALEKQPFLYALLEEISGRGLITSPVDEWKRHRKLLAPIFNQKNLESFVDIFLSRSRELVDRLQVHVDKGIFDFRDYAADYAINSAIDTILDLGEGKSGARDAHKLKEYMSSMFHASALRLTKVWYLSDFIFKRSSIGKEFAKAKENFHNLLGSIIENWMKDSEKKLAQAKLEMGVSETHKPKRLMEHMLSASDGSQKLTLEELKAEIKTILVASLETTSTTLGFLLMTLGMFPDIQEKVYQEVKQVLGTKKQLEYNDLKKLEYSERVIKEALRALPVAAGVARRSTKDIQLEHHVIPANSTILIAMVALHRDPNIWPNPTKFDPDRFLPEEEAKRHPYSWIPFSTGPRNCIGIRYAWISLKIFLATVILNYKVTTDYKSVEDVKLTMMLVFEPTYGYKVGITRR